MSSMLLDFDPYVTWLQVSAPQRPLNAYQILGLEPLDDNLARIRGSITRQRERLLAQRPQADPETWQQINDELEEAIAIMLSGERRAVLDATIKRRSGLGANSAAAAPIAGAPAVVACRHCQKENSGQRRFCAGCGQSLYEKCVSCGAEMAADERFCGICGADVQGARQEHEQRLADQLQQGKELAKAHRYDAALSVLRAVAAVDDRRYETLADEALAEISRVEELQRNQHVSLSDTLEAAQKQFAARAYETVMGLLDEVPVALRTEEMIDLLEHARSARNEILALSGEIRDALEAKRVTDLLPKIERMLTLRPGHAQARKLGEQIRDQFVATARKRIGEHRYEDALALLEQIPTFAATEESTALLTTTTELESLAADLRLSPAATQATLDLGTKLLKYAKTNEEIAKLLPQLAQRLKQRPTDARLAAMGWAAAPKRTPAGLPVDWLGYFTRPSAASDKVAATLREHPGEFFVALGLALQGVGEADAGVNLLPADKGNLLGKLSFSFGKKGPLMAWGLDLGDSGLRAIQLRRDEKTGEITIPACEYILHRQSLTNVDAPLEREVIVAETLKDFLSRGEVTGMKICVALAGHRVLGRFVEIPPMSAKKIPDAMAYEARHQIPIDMSELSWAYHLQQSDATKNADENPRSALLVAARLSHVQERVATFKSAGIAVDIVQSECLALHNAMRYEFAGDQAANVAYQGALTILDIGQEQSNLLVSGPQGVWFRTFGLGGENFTTALVKQFQLTRDQAEEWKRSPTKAKRYYQFREAIQPLLPQLAGEVERSLSSYARMFPDQPASRMLCIGGGAAIHGILRHLRCGK